MKSDHTALQNKLTSAQSSVRVGDVYSHYKHPERHYKIIALAFLESSEEMCVVYKSLYEPHFSWIRPLSNFLESVMVDGKSIPRFRLID